jgi:hypothetical protein
MWRTGRSSAGSSPPGSTSQGETDALLAWVIGPELPKLIRAATKAGPSVEDRQVELADALRVGDQVDLDDLPASDREAEDDTRRSARSTDQTRGSIHQRRSCRPGTPRGTPIRLVEEKEGGVVDGDRFEKLKRKAPTRGAHRRGSGKLGRQYAEKRGEPYQDSSSVGDADASSGDDESQDRRELDAAAQAKASEERDRRQALLPGEAGEPEYEQDSAPKA